MTKEQEEIAEESAAVEAVIEAAKRFFRTFQYDIVEPKSPTARLRRALYKLDEVRAGRKP